MELVEIAEKAGARVHWRGTAPLVSIEDAALIVETCRSLGCLILGIEGFHVDGDTTTPDMGAIADFSGLDDPESAALAAERFLRFLDASVDLVEFVVDPYPTSMA